MLPNVRRIVKSSSATFTSSSRLSKLMTSLVDEGFMNVNLGPNLIRPTVIGKPDYDIFET